MKRHQLSLLVAVGAAGHFDRAKLRVLLFFSASSRQRYAEHQRVGALLASALGADDDLIAMETRRPGKRRRRSKASAIVLGVLIGFILLEWGTYTLPRMLDLAKDIAHSCGLR